MQAYNKDIIQRKAIEKKYIALNFLGMLHIVLLPSFAAKQMTFSYCLKTSYLEKALKKNPSTQWQIRPMQLLSFNDVVHSIQSMGSDKIFTEQENNKERN